MIAIPRLQQKRKAEKVIKVLQWPCKKCSQEINLISSGDCLDCRVFVQDSGFVYVFPPTFHSAGLAPAGSNLLPIRNN